MKIGAIYPQIELRGDPKALHLIGKAADCAGYDYFVMFDHVLGAVHQDRDPVLWGPYTEKDPFHDPLVAFGYLAGITDRLELVTGVMVLPQRQTALVARQVADVDLLSAGRMRLGVGVGWNYVEFEALGQDFHLRGKRMSEQINILRELWQGSVVTHQGEFETLDRVALNPAPGRQIPIYCGGVSDPAYRRAARIADGFIFGGQIDGVIAAWRTLQDYLVVEDRDPATFGADYQLPDGTSPEAAVELMQRWRDAGGTQVAVRTTGLGYSCAEHHRDHLDRALECLKGAGI